MRPGRCSNIPRHGTQSWRLRMLRKRTVPRVCHQCHRPFLATKDAVRRGYAKFCSLACFHEQRAARLGFVRLVSRFQGVALCRCGCQQPTLLATHTITRHGIIKGQPLLYLAGHHHGGSQHYKYKGGRFIRSGYVWVRRPDHPDRDRYGYVAEHRLVWWEAHGPIPDNCVIHHLSGDTLDNRLQNLQMMTRSAHTRLHMTCGWARKHDCCTACGTTSVPHYARGLCQLCYKLVRKVEVRKRPATASPRRAWKRRESIA